MQFVQLLPGKTALFQVVQQHLLTFEQQWTDKSDGRTLPSFVTDELHDFLGCGVLARGLAQLFCPTCHERYVVAWSCKGRGFCPSCGGRRMNAGALTLVDHVLPEVPIRQFATGAAKPRGAGAGRAGPSPVGAPRRSSCSRWPWSLALRRWFLRLGGISRAIRAYSRRIAASAASACLPPCSSRRPSKKTSPREPCRSRTIFHGANCSEERSRSTRSALAARVPFASSLSSRPRTPSRRSWPAWVCPPRHLNPIRQDLLRLNRLNRGTAQST